MLKNQIVLFVSSNVPGESWQHLAQEWQWELIHHDNVMDALGAYALLFPAIIIVDSMSAVGQETCHHISSVLLDASQSPLILVTLTANNKAISVQNQVWRIDLPHACQTRDFIVYQLTQATNVAAKSVMYKRSQVNR
jgi:hypothetical protein